MLELYPHQEAAVARIEGEMEHRALLAPEPGTGKTLIALEVARRLGEHARVAVLVPASLAKNWVKEAGRLGMELVPYRKGREPARLCVASFSRAGALAAWPWDLLVVDESHFLKTPSAKRTRAAMALAARVPRRLLCTGTPMLNGRPAELWTSLAMLDPDSAGSYRDFTLKYCEGHVEKYGAVERWVAKGRPRTRELQAELDALLEPLMIRILLADVLDVPTITRRVVVLEPTAEDTRCFDAMRKKQQKLDRDGSKPAAEAHMMEFYRETSRRKLPAGRRWLREHLMEEPTAVFAHHGFVREAALEEARALCATVHVHGEVAMDQRQGMIDALREGRAHAGVLSYGTCALGFTLCPGVRRVVSLELTFRACDVLQAENRVCRLGTVERTTAVYLLMQGSFDEEMLRMVENKCRGNAAVIDGAPSVFVFADEDATK